MSLRWWLVGVTVALNTYPTLLPGNTADYAAMSNVSEKVLALVLLGPPILTFPHHKLEAFFEVSIAHSHPVSKGGR
jgi:hypothetical protein